MAYRFASSSRTSRRGHSKESAGDEVFVSHKYLSDAYGAMGSLQGRSHQVPFSFRIRTNNLGGLEPCAVDPGLSLISASIVIAESIQDRSSKEVLRGETNGLACRLPASYQPCISQNGGREPFSLECRVYTGH